MHHMIIHMWCCTCAPDTPTSKALPLSLLSRLSPSRLKLSSFCRSYVKPSGLDPSCVALRIQRHAWSTPWAYNPHFHDWPWRHLAT
jgi:hypothetical protein